MIDLQLKKAALDAKAAQKTEEIDNLPVGEGQSLDRNELLKILAAKN
jgi:Zn-finger nucleic acid-binding protein